MNPFLVFVERVLRVAALLKENYVRPLSKEGEPTTPLPILPPALLRAEEWGPCGHPSLHLGCF
jgi:hypothetical protein